jgi:hypothetical protein
MAPSYYRMFNPYVLKNGAQIDLDYHCGSMCGLGRTYELKRGGGVWRIVDINPR